MKPPVWTRSDAKVSAAIYEFLPKLGTARKGDATYRRASFISGLVFVHARAGIPIEAIARSHSLSRPYVQRLLSQFYKAGNALHAKPRETATLPHLFKTLLTPARVDPRVVSLLRRLVA